MLAVWLLYFVEIEIRLTQSRGCREDHKGLVRRMFCRQISCEVKIFMRPCGDSTSEAPRAALGIRLGHQPHLPHEAPGMG